MWWLCCVAVLFPHELVEALPDCAHFCKNAIGRCCREGKTWLTHVLRRREGGDSGTGAHQPPALSRTCGEDVILDCGQSSASRVSVILTSSERACSACSACNASQMRRPAG